MDTDKVILTVEAHNWVCACVGDWSTKTWKIKSDGSYILNTDFIRTEKQETLTGLFQPEVFKELEHLLTIPWEETHRNGCDGVGWSLTTEGKSTAFGYVDGCPVIERITKLMP